MYRFKRLLEFAQMATPEGVQQLWVTDNLQSRNAFVSSRPSRPCSRFGSAPRCW